MKTFDIKGSERKSVGKKSTKELRRNLSVPCVLYGGKKTIHFSIEEKAFQYLIYTPHAYIVNVDIDGKVHKAILQDVQFHAVTDAIVHVDFLEIDEKLDVSMLIPVKLNGLAIGVKDGGKLVLKQRKLRVKGLIKNFTDTLDIDITELKLGSSIKIGELSFDNMELLDPKNSVVARVKAARVIEVDEGAEGEEGEEGVEGAEDETEATTEGEAKE